MLTVMLCGARDTDAVLVRFRELGQAMGFTPCSFLDGTIRNRNIATVGWEMNSCIAIQQVDLFVRRLVGYLPCRQASVPE